MQRVERRGHVLPADAYLVGLPHRSVVSLGTSVDRASRFAEWRPEAHAEHKFALVELSARRVPAAETAILMPTLEERFEVAMKGDEARIADLSAAAEELGLSPRVTSAR